MKTSNVGLALIAALTLLALSPGDLRAGGDPTVRELVRRLNQLERRVDQLESERARSEEAKKAAEAEAEREREQVAALQQKLSQTNAMASSSEQTASRTQAALSALEEKSFVPGTKWGARAGYQDFPFHQSGGGFFYAVTFDHRLVSERDGAPFGDLDGEIEIANGQSGSEHLTVNTALLGPQNVEFRQDIVSIMAGPKYYFNFFKPYHFRPYIITGPGIWVDVMESPPLVAGQVPLPPQFASRKIPVVTTANAFPGWHAGAGFNYSLRWTRIPVIEKLNLGFDYRYIRWSSGDSFNAYSFALGFGGH